MNRRLESSQWRKDIEDALDAFPMLAELGGTPLAREDVEVEFLTAPHNPPTKLPPGKVAVYGFWGDGCWLKIGVAGQKSGARFSSQHYNAGSSRSNLAKSLQRCSLMVSRPDFLPNAPGEWIKMSTHRVNNRDKLLSAITERAGAKQTALEIGAERGQGAAVEMGL